MCPIGLELILEDSTRSQTVFVYLLGATRITCCILNCSFGDLILWRDGLN